MSVQAITCALALRGVSASEKLLLLALANYADDQMRCWPSQARLAADTCLTDRTVRGLLGALEDRGLLSRHEQRRKDGSRSSDLITLHFHGEVTKQAEIISGGAVEISGGAEMVSGGVRKSLPGGAEMVSGLTTFEPSPNPSKEPSCSAKPSANPSDGFSDFWKAYPKKVGKGAARKAYPKALGKIRSDDPHTLLMAALATVKRAWAGTDPQFIPHAATWLNQDRWEDEPLAHGPAPPTAAEMKPVSPEYLAQRRALLQGAR